MNRYTIKIGTPLSDAIDPQSSNAESEKEYVIFIDSSTRRKYKLFVIDGELTMSEVIES